MARPPDGMRRVNRNHLAGHQPVEQHADTSEMLLDRGRLHPLAQALNVLSDVDRLDLIERADPARVAPAQKTRRPRACTRRACSSCGYKRRAPKPLVSFPTTPELCRPQHQDALDPLSVEMLEVPRVAGQKIVGLPVNRGQ